MKTKCKKIISVLLVLCLTLGICTACGKSNSGDEDIKTSNIDTLEVLAHIKTEFPIDGDYLCYTSRYDGWEEFVASYYRFDAKAIDSITGFAMVSPVSVSADEYVVIKTTDTESVKNALDSYLKIRIGDFTGYAPEEEAKLSASEVIVCGDYVALLVNENRDVYDAFKESVKEGFELSSADRRTLELIDAKAKDISDEATEEVTETPSTSEEPADGEPGRKTLPDGQVLIEELPGVIEPYDTSHIVEAYKTGDDSLLEDPKDIAVLNKCKEIIASQINDGMTEYEKERAIHDYIIENTDYDENCLTYSNWYSEYADQPYGCLVDQRAICLGYATTFKLFMDMLDIECIIVKGSANSDYANHAWNLVKLEDGNWYAVDVTWDDPVGNYLVFYNYFNVDDLYLEVHSHHWNKEDYPKATGGSFSGLEVDKY